MVRGFVGVQQASVAELLERVDIVSLGKSCPALGVIVLPWAGDEAEVPIREFMGVHEPAVRSVI